MLEARTGDLPNPWSSDDDDDDDDDDDYCLPRCDTLLPTSSR
jgi:hypothetical protein